MGHATIEELLNLRDGTAVAAAVDAHVTGCGECRTELARLHALRAGLRALPALPPAPESWARVMARVEPPVQLIARRSRMRVAVAELRLAILKPFQWRCGKNRLIASGLGSTIRHLR